MDVDRFLEYVDRKGKRKNKLLSFIEKGLYLFSL
jgi:hypothetical protein